MSHKINWECWGHSSIPFILCISPPFPREMDMAALGPTVGKSQKSGNLQQQKQGKSRSCLCRQHVYWGSNLESL